MAWIAHWRNNHFLTYIIFVSLQCCASYLTLTLYFATQPRILWHVSACFRSTSFYKLCIQTVYLCYSTSLVNVAQKFNPNNLKFLKSVVYNNIRRMPLLRFQKMSITVTFKHGRFIFFIKVEIGVWWPPKKEWWLNDVMFEKCWFVLQVFLLTKANMLQFPFN